MQDDVSMNPSRGSPWGWFPVAMLLALVLYWAIGDALRIRVELYLFLPLLSGWLASRFGSRLTSFLLALAPICILSFVASLFPAFSIRLGIPLWVYVLAAFTAVSFARPRWGRLPAGVFEARWRWLRWLTLVAVWLAVFKHRDLLWKLSDTFQIGINPGFVLLMLVLAASLQWPTLSAWFRTVFWRGSHAPRKLLTCGLFAMLVLASLLHFRWEFVDAISLRFGFSSAYALVPVAAFLLAAFAILDWRLVVASLVAFFASEVVVSWLGETLAVLSDKSAVAQGAAVTREALGARLLSGAYVDWAGLKRAIAAVLLGVAIAPFWQHQNPASLRTRRTHLFLFLALVVLFFGMPNYFYRLGATSLMLVGGAAYVIGLNWQGRGIIAGPLLIQMLYLLSLIVRCTDQRCGASAYELVNIGLIAFAFAFFGLLSNRYQTPPSGADTQDAGKGKSKIIDISALASMVRRMDRSATLKSFVVVVAVLLVLTNLAKIADVLQSGLLEVFDQRGFVAAWVVTAIIAALAPLAFIVWDWMARQPWGHFAAIGGASIGGIGFAAMGAALGAWGANSIGELDGFPSADRFILFAALGLVVVALLGWLISASRRVRTILGWTLIMFAFFVCVLAVFVAALTTGLMGDPETTWEDYAGLAGMLVACAFVFWLIVRAVRHRIVLSGGRPRELLLGAIRRKNFWARLAFLAGLPSSLWHARAMLTPAFWAFLLARPLVYTGVLLFLGNVDVELDITGRITLGVAAIVGGHALFYTGKRLAARYIWDPAHPHDPRAPVLFLRSFEDDQLRFNRSRWDLIGRWFDLWSFRRNADEAMIDEIAQYGPVVALGMPGETNIPFGAMRYYSKHEDWQKIVTDTAKRAQAIVIGAGSTPGVMWEYALLARERLLDRTLLLFPPATGDRSGDSSALRAFAQATQTDVPLDTPEDAHLIALLSTDAGPTLLTASEPGAAAYVVAVRSHFQKCTATQLADPLIL
jgi:hypothetical protein